MRSLMIVAIAAVSTKVYGDDSPENRSKTRSLLSALKGQGRVNNPTMGHWEVTAKS